MKFLINLSMFVILSMTPAFGQGSIEKVFLPLEVRHELRTSEIPEEIEGKVWNRWTTRNFVVCSLDNTQAQYLHRHLESVKAWAFSRWGMYEVDFSQKCMFICVNDPALFEKMFRISETKVEVRREANGKIKESVIFLLINDSPSRTVPGPLMEVCLAEFSQKYDANFGWWSYRGMGLLNGSIDQIRESLSQLAPSVAANESLYFSEGILMMTQSQYNRLDNEKKQLYDYSALTFCLLVRKEFGQDKFHWLLKKTSEGNPEVAIKDVLKFNSYEHFDRTFKRYLIDLIGDVAANKTPDSYLQIRQKEKK